jgi:hypothetical protein
MKPAPARAFLYFFKSFAIGKPGRSSTGVTAENWPLPSEVSKNLASTPGRSFLCVRGGSLLGLRDNAKIRLRSLPPLGIDPFGFVV